jgi:ABC-2 type transport system permease protein
MLLVLLPFFGSGFVPTASMPGGLRWFAEHQPFTPLIDAVRGSLTGHVHGSSIAWALVWFACLAVTGWALSLRLYKRERPNP